MKKVLFLIHDLGQGGAEKVLVNLVNHMDRTRFDITVMALFGGGVNEPFLSDHVRMLNCHPKAYPGNSRVMKLLPPAQLWRRYIKERYDIAVAYLEGPAARIVSGCPDTATKLVSWTHRTIGSRRDAARSFRSWREAVACYQKFDVNVFVSADTRDCFCTRMNGLRQPIVLYNTNDTGRIMEMAAEPAELPDGGQATWRLCAVGKLIPGKGFDRLLRIHARLLSDGIPLHTYLLGQGPEQKRLEQLIRELGIETTVTLLGYQTNPYKFMAQCDLFVCASYNEGFSTAATEALIVGVPVCTTDVSGMRELLGSNQEYGIIAENEEASLYQEIRRLLTVPGLLEAYRKKAAIRGRAFRTETTVRAVEEMLWAL